MRWSIFKLDTSKLQEAIAQNLRPRSDGGPNASVEAKTKELICWLAQISDSCMPRNKGNPKRKPVPWWSENIATIRADCLRRRRIYLRKRRRVSEEECHNEALTYKEAKKQLVLAIKNAKSRCWAELCNEVEHDPWGRPYLTVTKKLGQRRPIVVIELPGRLENIISELFPTDVNGDTTKVQWLFDPNDFPRFTASDILEEASTLPNGKAPGPDGIHDEVLKAAVKADPHSFLQVYNQCITESVYPWEWKKGKLVLIPKPGKPPEAPSSYRTLCMIDTTGKLFEKLIVRRLKDHLSNVNAISNAQNGFRKGRSTLDSFSRIREITNRANSGAYHHKKVVSMITLDVKNAFNSAQWNDIINALIKMAVPDYLISIIQKYLCDRSASISTPSGHRTIEVTRGVLQGSALGLDLWNVM